jgi:hypothetical protein
MAFGTKFVWMQVAAYRTPLLPSRETMFIQLLPGILRITNRSARPQTIQKPLTSGRHGHASPSIVDFMAMRLKPQAGRRSMKVAVAGLVVLFLTVFVALRALSSEPPSPSELSLGARELQDLSPFEKSILKDKVVTPTELRQSTHVFIECLNTNHIGHEVIAGDPGPSGIQVDMELLEGAEEASKNKEVDACLDNVSAVEAVWLLQNQPNQSDIEEAKADYVACVRHAGVNLAANATAADAGAAARQFNQGGSANASTPRGRQASALLVCLETLVRSTQTALPGLGQALESLDTSGW